MKVLITGGSGLIGRSITHELLKQDISVVHLTRNCNSLAGVKTYEWDWEKKQIDTSCFKDVTHIIHLAGAGIADKPWTMRRKRFIVKSRVHTTRLLNEKVNELNLPLKAFISASGTGYYGAQTIDKIFDEKEPAYKDFIAECCVQWEEAADLFETNSRVVKLRLGIVLNKNEGALPKLSSFINKGIGSAIGSGKQYMPWIHLDDAVNLFIESLKNEKMKGVYNAVAPEHQTNKEFTIELAKALNKKVRVPNVPPFVLKTIYGELADILLYGSRVSSEKLLKEGFQFKYNELNKALDQIYNQ